MSFLAIGIDLGTTNTLAAAIAADGHSLMLPLSDGRAALPSAVLFAADRTIVGQEAQLRGRANPERFAACAKRSLGHSRYEHRIAGEWLPPEVIQACILERLKREHAAVSTATARVVVAVPAHFNAIQRQRTAQAAEIAGLSLLELVNEPIASALAFAEDAPGFMLGEAHGVHYYLVYDLGGYTFEASVVAVRPGEIKLVATEHDQFLGGHQWDLRLAELLVGPAIRAGGRDPREDPRLLEAIVQRAAQVKCALSDRDEVDAHLEYSHPGYSCHITRDQFEAATADLLSRTEGLCQRVLDRAEVSWTDLRQVLLVGGATRMPMVRRLLGMRLGRDVDTRVAPEEAVARGAAIYARQILNHDRPPPALQVTSTSTHSLGIEGIDQDTGKHINRVIIPRGTPLPASVTQEFPGRGGSRHAIRFNVLEGDDPDPAKCLRIGQIVLGDLPAEVAESWPVDVTCEYSPSGQLSVMAQVRYTDRAARLLLLRPGGVSQAHLDRWKAVVTAQAGFDAYLRVRAWEKTTEAAPPVVVAGASPGSTESAGADDADAVESDEPAARRNFLRRWMPFLFRAPPTDE